MSMHRPRTCQEHGSGWTPNRPRETPERDMLELRPLVPADAETLRAYLREDVWNHVYALGLLSWYGIGSPRTRFIGAFRGGRLVGVLAEGREVHCWYASLGAVDAEVAAALGRGLVEPRIELLAGRADL